MGFEQEAFDAMMADVGRSEMTLWDEMRRAGKGEPFVLKHLEENGPSAPSHLAAALKVSSGRISTMLGAMEKKGYITREIDPNDRRGIKVTLTDRGREQVERYREDMRERICWVFSQMGERRTRELLDLAGEFSVYMSLCKPGAPMPTAEQVAEAFAKRVKR